MLPQQDTNQPPSNDNQSDIELPSRPIQSTTHAPHFKNILCIEDEYFIGELYERALKKAGYNITLTPDGEKGLAEAKTNKYDIILLDIMIPSITGIELLKRLRSEMPDLRAKVIITTNLEQNEAARAEIERQADGYIIKAEVTPKQLVDFLQSLERNPANSPQ